MCCLANFTSSYFLIKMPSLYFWHPQNAGLMTRPPPVSPRGKKPSPRQRSSSTPPLLGAKNQMANGRLPPSYQDWGSAAFSSIHSFTHSFIPFIHSLIHSLLAVPSSTFQHDIKELRKGKSECSSIQLLATWGHCMSSLFSSLCQPTRMVDWIQRAWRQGPPAANNELLFGGIIVCMVLWVSYGEQKVETDVSTEYAGGHTHLRVAVGMHSVSNEPGEEIKWIWINFTLQGKVDNLIIPHTVMIPVQVQYKLGMHTFTTVTVNWRC